MNPDPKTLTLRLPYPPSVGNCWGRTAGGRSYLKPAGQAFRLAVINLVEKSKQPGFTGPVGVEVDVTFPDWIARDLDNLSKAVLDALTHAKVWQDDLQVREVRWVAKGIDPNGKGWIDVRITALPAEHPWWVCLTTAKKIGSKFWQQLMKGVA
jgi:crossover junction endodeoxyribonuclease RusA